MEMDMAIDCIFMYDIYTARDVQDRLGDWDQSEGFNKTAALAASGVH